MKQMIMDKVDLLSEQMMLHYASPNNNLVVQVLELDASTIPTVPDDDLTKYIIVLGQYLVMLQHNINLKSVRHLIISKTYEHKIMIKTITRDFSSNIKTDKAKRAMILDSDEEIKEMYIEVMAAEAEKLILHNMDKPVESLLNALKKEKSTRSNSPQEY